MGATVAALEAAGLVKGSPDPNDGRQTILSLTPACAARFRTGRAARHRLAVEDHRAELTPPEQRTAGDGHQTSQPPRRHLNGPALRCRRQHSNNGEYEYDDQYARCQNSLARGRPAEGDRRPAHRAPDRGGDARTPSSCSSAFRQLGLPVVLINVAGGAPGRIEQSRIRGELPEGWADLVPSSTGNPVIIS